jgi:hypothetical protein
MKPNAPSVLERSIYWQRHVAANTRDPRQKARALAAVEKLTEELKLATEQLASATEHEPSATEHEPSATNLKENHK